MEQFLETIKRICQFTSDELQKISEMMVHKKYRQHDLFVTEGQKCRHVAFILSGFMRKFFVGEDGAEITTDFSLPNAFSGAYYGFHTQKPSIENIQAMTECEVLLLSYDSLQELYRSSFSMNVMGRKVLENSCIQREIRIKQTISLSALDRYKWFVEEFGDVYKVAQLQHIASFLGIKPETLSRQRRKMTIH